MKTDREVIHLYAGENHPKVQLTRVREFSHIRDLISYFHSIQDTFYIEFETCETITENLKVRCVSYGGDEFDGTVPFFILEYDEILNSLYVWMSEGKWEFNKLISNLFMSNTNNDSITIIKSHAKFREHERRDIIELVIDRLNVDWGKIDLNEFWNQLEETIDPQKDDQSSLKGYISMALLKTKVIKNKKLVSRSLTDYCQKMKSNCQLAQHHDSDNTPKNDVIEDSKDQVVTNFNSHFKLMAENYETFDLKNWAAFPMRKPRQHGSQQKNRISKVKS